ncbi:hypothetical protein D9M71_598340 [compost metagenome]
MRHLPEQGLDQRALAAAVGADQGMHATGGDLEADLIENPRAAQGQVDAGELDVGPARLADDGFGDAHAFDSLIARTTVSRLRFISTSYFSLL